MREVAREQLEELKARGVTPQHIVHVLLTADNGRLDPRRTQAKRLAIDKNKKSEVEHALGLLADLEDLPCKVIAAFINHELHPLGMASLDDLAALSSEMDVVERARSLRAAMAHLGLGGLAFSMMLIKDGMCSPVTSHEQLCNELRIGAIVEIVEGSCGLHAAEGSARGATYDENVPSSTGTWEAATTTGANFQGVVVHHNMGEPIADSRRACWPYCCFPSYYNRAATNLRAWG